MDEEGERGRRPRNSNKKLGKDVAFPVLLLGWNQEKGKYLCAPLSIKLKNQTLSFPLPNLHVKACRNEIKSMLDTFSKKMYKDSQNCTNVVGRTYICIEVKSYVLMVSA